MNETPSVPDSEVEPKPKSVVMPFSSLLKLRSGGETFGMYRDYDIYPHLFSVLMPALVAAKCEVFESTLTDAVEFSRTGQSLGAMTTRLFPWRFAPEIQDVRNRNTTYGDRSTQWTMQVMDSFLTGSDFDGRLDISPDRFLDFVKEIVHTTVTTLRIKERHVTTTQTEDTLKVSMRVDEDIIECWPRPEIATLAHPSITGIPTHHTPIITIEAGVWNSGIPYMYWGIDADSDGNYDYPSTPIFRAGFAPKRELLSEAQQEADTRTGHAVNSWDSQYAKLTDKISSPVFNIKAMPQLEPNTWLPYRNVATTQSGLVKPTLGGTWTDEGEYHIPTRIPGSRESGLTTKETFITIPPETVEKLTQENKLGEEFGRLPVDRALPEFFRWLRKSLRYRGVPDISTAECLLIQGSQTREGKTMREELDSLSEQSKAEVKLAIARELMVIAYYAPRELILIGNELRLNQFFPRWNLIDDLAANLPTQNEIKEALVNSASLVDRVSTDGIHYLIDALKQKHPERFSGVNTLEIAAWLFEIEAT